MSPGSDHLRLVLATRNPHKLDEIAAILDGLDVELVSVAEFPGVPDVEEDGETFEENAIKKARVVSRETGLPALADDTGLEVHALGGAPGVFSARYSGEPPDYDRNNDKLLRELEGAAESERGAQFRCVIALAMPDGRVETVEGKTTGRILQSRRGEGGFGYDPLFLPDGSDRTYAEMSADEKNACSHRGKAVRAARRLVEGLPD
ncbi:MAG: XTP/dITP diphosphatase [Candidatus Eisenbacteria bacterium]|nr:XTP/dITP diphosphatase [Candidatus Eisenbacteria bacterium]